MCLFIDIELNQAEPCCVHLFINQQEQPMKTARFHHADEAEINITPMMDVVFIMLIFFIVTTSFTKETGIGVSRHATSTVPTPDQPVAAIKLGIEGHSINDQVVTLEGIESRLAQMKAAHPELKAQILSSKDLRIDTLVRAVEQVELADIKDFSVSAY